MRRDENEPDAPDATLDGAKTVVDAPVAETVVVPERSPTIAETLVVPQPSPTIAQTVVVADDARPHPAAETVRVPDEPAPSKRAAPRPSHRMARLWLAAVVVVVALFLASASAALLLGFLTSIDARSAAPSYASCEGEPPSAVVIAELAQGSPLPTREDLVAHVAALPPASVTVHRRARAAGRAVTLELSSSSWPDWARLAEGASGRDVCDRIAEAIASRGAHAHSFHAGRPRHATEEPVLAFAPVETSHAAIVDWLAPLEVAARCTFEPGRRDVGTLTIACDVFNPRPIGARVRIAPALYGAGAPRSLHHDERVLGPRERISPRYEISIRPDAVTRECGCEVATASP